MTQPAIPLRLAADKAMKSVGAKRADKTDDEIDSDIRKEDNKYLKNAIDRIIKLKSELADTNADIKGIYDAAAEKGYDRGAIKTIVKHRTKEISQEFRQNVNQYCLALDMPVIYRLEATN